MMKLRRGTILSLITVLLFSVFAMGCGEKATDVQSAQYYWEAVVMGDSTNIDKIGGSESDVTDFYNNSVNKTKTAMRPQLITSKLKFSDEDMDNLIKAIFDAGKKATVKEEEVSKDGKKAEVKYTINYIDLTPVYTEASQEALNEVKTSGLTSQSELYSKYSELYLSKVLEKLKNVEPSSDTIEKTFTFVKEKNVWTPEDKDKFADELLNAATNSNH